MKFIDSHILFSISFESLVKTLDQIKRKTHKNLKREIVRQDSFLNFVSENLRSKDRFS